MAHTPEQRDRHALCDARKKNGERCRNFAGQGTSHFGVGRCRFHFGNAPNHEKNAVRVEAQRRAVEFGQPLDVHPSEALLTVLQLSAGHLAWLRSALSGFEDKTTFEGQVLMRMWDDERDRVARISKAALDAGVQERQVQLAERYGEALAQVLRNIFGDPELGLTDGQRAQLPAVLRRHLVALDGGAAGVLLPAGR
jgi:hypothetical protein